MSFCFPDFNEELCFSSGPVSTLSLILGKKVEGVDQRNWKWSPYSHSTSPLRGGSSEQKEKENKACETYFKNTFSVYISTEWTTSVFSFSLNRLRNLCRYP